MDGTIDKFSYIKSEEAKFKTDRVPLTNSKDWNMSEHIERCTNVANGWFHKGANDGLRPYDDIVTPIINVAFRSEGFDVKDIVPYVNDIKQHYKSFIVKKRHPRWARDNQLDTFIDEVVETSIIYDLVLVKDLKNTRPEVVDLKTIAFCDQTDVMAGPICIRHNMTIADLKELGKKWDDDKITQAILMSNEEKRNYLANDQTAKTPSKNIEVYELRGGLPENWLKADGDPFKYVPQMHMVCYYHDKSGNRHGITLYQGKDKPLSENFFALKIDQVRSKGRACGRSIVETLFEPQVWNNYSAIKIKQLLDSAITVFQTDSEEYAGQKLSELKPNTILKHETGKPISKLDGQIQNLPAFTNHQQKMQNDARVLGSATDPQLGVAPVSGTPFALQSLVVQTGQGFHEYRQGKISTFFADVLYPKLILPYLVADLNSGKDFSEELTLDEMLEIRDTVATKAVNKIIIDRILNGLGFEEGEQEAIFEAEKQKFMQSDKRKFFSELKGEFADIPVSVFINIKGKQKDLPALADKLTNLIREGMKNPQAAQIFAKQYNELLESSGFSPIDFTSVTKQQAPSAIPSPVAPEALPVA
jgi:hypothetical protein